MGFITILLADGPEAAKKEVNISLSDLNSTANI